MQLEVRDELKNLTKEFFQKFVQLAPEVQRLNIDLRKQVKGLKIKVDKAKNNDHKINKDANKLVDVESVEVIKEKQKVIVLQKTKQQ